MPNVAAPVSGQLQPIAGRHECNETVGPFLYVFQHILLQLCRRLEVLFQFYDPSNGLAQIRHNHPVFASMGIQLK